MSSAWTQGEEEEDAEVVVKDVVVEVVKDVAVEAVEEDKEQTSLSFKFCLNLFKSLFKENPFRIRSSTQILEYSCPQYIDQQISNVQVRKN
jgi:hypothetical protein